MPNAVFLYICLVGCSFLIAIPKTHSHDKLGVVDRLFPHSSLRRSKRSITKIIDVILKPATLRFKMRGYKVFHKTGGWRDALRDFNKLHPMDIHSDGIRRRGAAGDWYVEVHRATKRKADLTIKPIHEGDQETLVIEYDYRY